MPISDESKLALRKKFNDLEHEIVLLDKRLEPLQAQVESIQGQLAQLRQQRIDLVETKRKLKKDFEA